MNFRGYFQALVNLSFFSCRNLTEKGKMAFKQNLNELKALQINSLEFDSENEQIIRH